MHSRPQLRTGALAAALILILTTLGMPSTVWAAGSDPVSTTAGETAGSPISPKVDIAQRKIKVEGSSATLGRTLVKDFQMVGVTWSGENAPSGVTVSIAVHSQGKWQATQTVTESDDTEGRRGIEPLWVGEGADGVSVKVTAASGTLRDVKVATIDPGNAANVITVTNAFYRATSALNIQSVADGTPTVVPMPNFVTRAQWGAGPGTKCSNPGASKSLGFTLHHTAGSNTATKAQSASIVRGYQTYHVSGRGWCDIGYNFLVDSWGQTFEGRKGGVTNQVYGAHSGVTAVNQYSASVSMMGTFETVEPPEAMKAAVVRLIGWRFVAHGVKAKGTFTVGGKTYNTILGHRDAKSTACPGAMGYAWIGAAGGLRDRVAAYISKATSAGGVPTPAVNPDLRRTPDGSIWLIVGSMKHHIASYSDFLTFQSKFGEPTDVADADLAAYTTGNPATRVVRDAASGAAYLLQVDGKKSHFTSMESAEQYGYPVSSWVDITATQAGAFEDGVAVGTTFAVENDTKLYTLSGKTKRWILTAAALKQATGGTTFVRVSADWANALANGAPILPKNSLVTDPAGSEVYLTIGESKLVHIPSFALAAEFGVSSKFEKTATGALAGITKLPHQLSPFVVCGTTLRVVTQGGLASVVGSDTAGFKANTLSAAECAAFKTAAAAIAKPYLAQATGNDAIFAVAGGKAARVPNMAALNAIPGWASVQRIAWSQDTIKSLGGTFPAAATAPAATAPAAVTPALAATDVVTTTSSTVTFKGHGYGHGIGMSQHGAQGAAKAGVGYAAILAHYYPGTTLSPKSASIRVLLKADTTSNVLVDPAAGLKFRNLASRKVITLPKTVKSRKINRWSIQPKAWPKSKTVLRYRSGSKWYTYKTWTGEGQFEGPTAISLILPSGAKVKYRGALRSAYPSKGSSARDTLNVLSLEDYTRGVVAREMPSGWMAEALKAQAVAARTYGARSLSSSRYYDICDTTSCQVYGGYSAEKASTNNAVSGTSGQVLTYKGAVALAQFSSASGGYTNVGSQPYLKAVQDDWDNYAGNTVHNWTTSVKKSTIQSKYPAIGTLASVTVTKRNGYGNLGGRVVSVTLKGSKGSKTISGVDARWAFGLRSDWFGF